MADDPKFDFNELVREAKQEAKIDVNRSCWPWSHKWRAWQLEEQNETVFQYRHCSHCNRLQKELVSGCIHSWKFSEEYNVTVDKRVVKKIRLHTCKKCGQDKKVEIT